MYQFIFVLAPNKQTNKQYSHCCETNGIFSKFLHLRRKNKKKKYRFSFFVALFATNVCKKTKYKECCCRFMYFFFCSCFVKLAIVKSMFFILYLNDDAKFLFFCCFICNTTDFCKKKKKKKEETSNKYECDIKWQKIITLNVGVVIVVVFLLIVFVPFFQLCV